jgi:hypothetical protein
MLQLPPQDKATMDYNWNVIGDWFGKDKTRWFMIMCKERSDFTLLHILNNNFFKGVQELQEILGSRGKIWAIQYQHGEDTFEIWVKIKDEMFMFMLFGADWMVVEAG